MKLVVDKWFVDKGFGFGKVPTGEVIFIHASNVRDAEVLMIGTDAWVQVVRDDARAQRRYRASQSLGTRRVDRGERDKERASKVAEQVRRAAALTAELAALSRRKKSPRCAATLQTCTTSQPKQAMSRRRSRTARSLGHAGAVLVELNERISSRAQEFAARLDRNIGVFRGASTTNSTRAKKSQPCLTKHWVSTFTRMKLESLRKERDH